MFFFLVKEMVFIVVFTINVGGGNMSLCREDNYLRLNSNGLKRNPPRKFSGLGSPLGESRPYGELLLLEQHSRALISM